MFTGIIEELGRVKRLERRRDSFHIRIQADRSADDVQIGDSISVNGVCLTVVSLKNKILAFDVIAPTFEHTTLKDLRVNDEVNLERALRVGDRLAGHFVTGHVDCIGTIRARRVFRANSELRIAVPHKFLKDLIPKGSVALDGISLTIQGIKQGTFFVSIIPHTSKTTTLKNRLTGSRLNVELDLLAKRVSYNGVRPQHLTKGE
jgi:riboflavin synthase